MNTNSLLWVLTGALLASAVIIAFKTPPVVTEPEEDDENLAGA